MWRRTCSIIFSKSFGTCSIQDWSLSNFFWKKKLIGLFLTFLRVTSKKKLLSIRLPSLSGINITFSVHVLDSETTACSSYHQWLQCFNWRSLWFWNNFWSIRGWIWIYAWIEVTSFLYHPLPIKTCQFQLEGNTRNKVRWRWNSKISEKWWLSQNYRTLWKRRKTNRFWRMRRNHFSSKVIYCEINLKNISPSYREVLLVRFRWLQGRPLIRV